MARVNDEVVVRDLGSTNGIRINGRRVGIGRLRPGDELAIAHIRYRFEGEEDSEQASNPAIREQDSTPESSRPRTGSSPRSGISAPCIRDETRPPRPTEGRTGRAGPASNTPAQEAITSGTLPMAIPWTGPARPPITFFLLRHVGPNMTSVDPTEAGRGQLHSRYEGE